MMGSALTRIEALGTQLQKTWAEHAFAPEAFIELCTTALTHARLEQQLSAGQILAEIAGRAALPEDPPVENRVVDEQLTLFRCPEFVIQVLVWLDGITDIHDHRLSGAYVALEGERIEAQYRFLCDERLDESIRIGRIETVALERVRPGQVRPFTPGADYLHAVFHLHHPSVTLAIRAPRLDVDAGFNYHRPGIAVRGKANARVRQRIQALQTLHLAGYAEQGAALEHALLEAEPLELYLLLNHFRGVYSQRLPELRALLSRLREKRGPWVNTLARSFAERTRMLQIRGLRQAERDVNFRLALALILHAQTLDDVEGARAPEVLSALQLIAEQVPELRADVLRLTTG